MKYLTLAVLFATLLVSCGGEKQDASREQSERDVLDLVVRTELLRLHESDTTWGQRSVYLALGSLGPSGFNNPPDELINGLSDMPMRVVSVAQRDTTGSSQDQGVLFAVEIRKWLSPTRVELNVGKNESGQISGYSLRLVKSGGKWIFVHSFNFYSS